MLSKENTGYASTCNTVGQTIGYFTAYTVFLAFNSKEFCNNYIRSVPSEEAGLLSLSQFMFFWGTVFIIVTLAVWFLQKEKVHADGNNGDEEEEISLTDAYKQIVQILKLPSILSLCLVLLTVKAGGSSLYIYIYIYIYIYQKFNFIYIIVNHLSRCW